MWDKLAPPWQACLALSWQSFREGSLPIAAVITDPEGAIVAQGRNRVGIREVSTRQEISGNPLAHAEINALLALDYTSLNPRRLTLYTTVEPCPLCIGAICMAGVRQFHYAARDPWAGSTNLLTASPYLRKKRITAHGPGDPTLESIIQTLQAASDVHHNHPNIHALLKVWAADHPRSIELGVQFFHNGELRQLIARDIPIGAVVDGIAERLNS